VHVEYSGIDLSHEYIETAGAASQHAAALSNRGGPQREREVRRDSRLWSAHHLDDLQVTKVLASAVDLLAADGRLIIIGPTLRG
jgi:hypothetical protein